MSKANIKDLSRFHVSAPKTEKTDTGLFPIKKANKQVRRAEFDPEGMKAIEDLLAIYNGDRKRLAAAMGGTSSLVSAWFNGKRIKKTYVKLARFLTAEWKAAHAPKIKLKAKVHSAVITLSNEHQDDFRDAVVGAGGTYHIVEYPEV